MSSVAYFPKTGVRGSRALSGEGMISTAWIILAQLSIDDDQVRPILRGRPHRSSFGSLLSAHALANFCERFKKEA
jgi:hypothetical protein